MAACGNFSFFGNGAACGSFGMFGGPCIPLANLPADEKAQKIAFSTLKYHSQTSRKLSFEEYVQLLRESLHPNDVDLLHNGLLCIVRILEGDEVQDSLFTEGGVYITNL